MGDVVCADFVAGEFVGEFHDLTPILFILQIFYELLLGSVSWWGREIFGWDIAP
jgi:hypothetical protein